MPDLLLSRQNSPEPAWSETSLRMCPGSPSMLKQTVRLLKGKSTTKWGSPSAPGQGKNGRKRKKRHLLGTFLCKHFLSYFLLCCWLNPVGGRSSVSTQEDAWEMSVQWLYRCLWKVNIWMQVPKFKSNAPVTTLQSAELPEVAGASPYTPTTTGPTFFSSLCGCS